MAHFIFAGEGLGNLSSSLVFYLFIYLLIFIFFSWMKTFGKICEDLHKNHQCSDQSPVWRWRNFAASACTCTCTVHACKWLNGVSINAHLKQRKDSFCCACFALVHTYVWQAYVCPYAGVIRANQAIEDIPCGNLGRSLRGSSPINKDHQGSWIIMQRSLGPLQQSFRIPQRSLGFCNDPCHNPAGPPLASWNDPSSSWNDPWDTCKDP